MIGSKMKNIWYYLYNKTISMSEVYYIKNVLGRKIVLDKKFIDCKNIYNIQYLYENRSDSGSFVCITFGAV